MDGAPARGPVCGGRPADQRIAQAEGLNRVVADPGRRKEVAFVLWREEPHPQRHIAAGRSQITEQRFLIRQGREGSTLHLLISLGSRLRREGDRAAVPFSSCAKGKALEGPSFEHLVKKRSNYMSLVGDRLNPRTNPEVEGGRGPTRARYRKCADGGCGAQRIRSAACGFSCRGSGHRTAGAGSRWRFGLGPPPAAGTVSSRQA